LEEDEAELQRLISRLEDALADVPPTLREGRPFAELRGQLAWPVNGRVRQGFGDARAGGRMRWRGMLIEAGEGTDVRAISHGRVAYSGWLQHYGLVLVLDHGDGWLSLYGHNRSVYPQVGEWVNPGDVVASVGDSGGRDRSGLYFEIRRGGDPVDPAAWLGRR
jgi:murein hydrolase activator